MPVETLRQLRALRQGIAESLQKDPRFLTLNSLDTSIGEIGRVLVAAGVITADEAPQATPAFFAAAEPAKSAAPAAAAPQKKKKKKKRVEAQSAVAATGDSTPEKAAAQPATPAAAQPAVVAAVAAKDEDAADDADEDEEGDEASEPEAAPKMKAAAGKPADCEAEDEAEEDEAGDGEAATDNDGASATGRAAGYVAMAAKPGAAQYQPSAAVKFVKLPNIVDLRPLMTPVEDQGQTSSCVANAVVGAYEYWVKKATRQDDDISRLFVYYNARWRDGSQDKDEGSVIQLAMEGLAKFGACSEKVWPFDKKLLLQKPGADAYKDAAPRRVQDMAQVPLTVEAWKQALAEGKPIVFGCLLFDSFDQCNARGGVVPMPAPEDLSRKSHSGHAMCAVGYSDTEKVFIVRNSWGSKWGDKGYCYMPYDYLMNSRFNDGDCWVFVPRVPMPPPRDVWSDTTRPVTNDGRGVDFVINPYTVEDYARVAIDLFETVRRPFNATLLPAYSEYVSWASLSQWSRFEQFDVSSFLSQTSVTEQISEVSSTSTSLLETTTETSEDSAEETFEEDDEDSEDADADAEDVAEADDADDEDAEDSDDDEAADDDESEDSDDDAADEDADDSEESDEEPEDDDAESDDDADADDDADDAEEDGSDDDESDDATDDDAADDDAEESDDDAEDDSDDGGGDDEGGDDDSGGGDDDD